MVQTAGRKGLSAVELILLQWLAGSGLVEKQRSISS